MAKRVQGGIGGWMMAVLGLVAWMGAGEALAATTTATDGTTIHYEVQGAGEPTLVFIHGWSCDATYWREQVGPFSADHRVVTVDLAGHGASGQQRTDYTVEAFGGDVAAVLAAEDIATAIVIGHSMGGPVALEAALAAPARVIGVIGVDEFHDLGVTLTDEQIAGFTAPFAGDFAAAVAPWARSMFAAGDDSTLADAVAQDMASAPPAVGRSAMDNLLHWFNRASGRAGLLTVNLTAVNADKWPTDVEGNRRFIPGFEARILPGTGHFLMLTHPREFNALLAAAVQEFAGAAGKR